MNGCQPRDGLGGRLLVGLEDVAGWVLDVAEENHLKEVCAKILKLYGSLFGIIFLSLEHCLQLIDTMLDDDVGNRKDEKS